MVYESQYYIAIVKCYGIVTGGYERLAVICNKRKMEMNKVMKKSSIILVLF